MGIGTNKGTSSTTWSSVLVPVLWWRLGRCFLVAVPSEDGLLLVASSMDFMLEWRLMACLRLAKILPSFCFSCSSGAQRVSGLALRKLLRLFRDAKLTDPIVDSSRPQLREEQVPVLLLLLVGKRTKLPGRGMVACVMVASCFVPLVLFSKNLWARREKLSLFVRIRAVPVVGPTNSPTRFV